MDTRNKNSHNKPDHTQPQTSSSVELITLAGDLSHHPKELFQVAPTDEVTIGDLHGNTLKLIYFLIQAGVMTLQHGAKDYYRLYQLYMKCDRKRDKQHFTQHDVTEFMAILEAATIQPCKVRLIGDECADRGFNDYLTLLVLQKLNTSDVTTSILLSNHGAEFVMNLLADNPTYEPRFLALMDQASSMVNLRHWITKGVIDAQEVQKLAQAYYLPHLKLIDYALQNDVEPPIIHIYTHAPVALETIQAFARYYQIPYDQHSVNALATTIDAINHQFQADLIKNGLRQFAKEMDACINQEGSLNISIDYPFARLTWGRHPYRGSLKTMPSTKAFECEFYHGHEGPTKRGCYAVNMTNLDNTHFGKGLIAFADDYQFQRSKNVGRSFTPSELTILANPLIKKIKVTRNEQGELCIAVDALSQQFPWVALATLNSCTMQLNKMMAHCALTAHLSSAQCDTMYRALKQCSALLNYLDHRKERHVSENCLLVSMRGLFSFSAHEKTAAVQKLLRIVCEPNDSKNVTNTLTASDYAALTQGELGHLVASLKLTTLLHAYLENEPQAITSSLYVTS